MVGVWIAPVTAQVMMTLSDLAAIWLSRFVSLGLGILERHQCRAARAAAQFMAYTS